MSADRPPPASEPSQVPARLRHAGLVQAVVVMAVALTSVSAVLAATLGAAP